MASSRVIVGMNDRTMSMVCSSAGGAMFVIGSSLRLFAQVRCGVAPGVVAMLQARRNGYQRMGSVRRHGGATGEQSARLQAQSAWP
jgi:hypothetical protein